LTRFTFNEIIGALFHHISPLSFFRSHYESFPTSAHSARFICASGICPSQDYLSNWNSVARRAESPCGDHLSWAHRSRFCLDNDWGVRMLSPQLFDDILSSFW
jgi:hypothetical protein